MNNKLITYEQAKEELRELEMRQKRNKRWLSTSAATATKGYVQYRIHKRKEEINMLLSIIHAHKQARKYYGKMKKLHDVIEKDRGYTNPFYKTREIDE